MKLSKQLKSVSDHEIVCFLKLLMRPERDFKAGRMRPAREVFARIRGRKKKQA